MYNAVSSMHIHHFSAVDATTATFHYNCFTHKNNQLQVTPADCGRWKEVAAASQGMFPSTGSTSALTEATVTISNIMCDTRYIPVKQTVTTALN